MEMFFDSKKDKKDIWPIEHVKKSRRKEEKSFKHHLHKHLIFLSNDKGDNYIKFMAIIKESQ